MKNQIKNTIIYTTLLATLASPVLAENKLENKLASDSTKVEQVDKYAKFKKIAAYTLPILVTGISLAIYSANYKSNNKGVVKTTIVDPPYSGH